jgi:PAS domain S-box-containing protein
MLRGRRPSERAAAHLQLLLAQLPSSFVWTTSADLRLTSAAGTALSLIGLGETDALIGKKLQTILAGGRDGGAAIVNAHERISPYIEQLLGYPSERWLREDDFWVTVLHPDDRDAALEGATRTHETGEPFRGTYRMVAENGRVVTLLDETIPVSDEQGRALFLQGFLLDVGETT